MKARLQPRTCAAGPTRQQQRGLACLTCSSSRHGFLLRGCGQMRMAASSTQPVCQINVLCVGGCRRTCWSAWGMCRRRWASSAARPSAPTADLSRGSSTARCPPTACPRLPRAAAAAQVAPLALLPTLCAEASHSTHGRLHNSPLRSTLPTGASPKSPLSKGDTKGWLGVHPQHAGGCSACSGFGLCCS